MQHQAGWLEDLRWMADVLAVASVIGLAAVLWTLVRGARQAGRVELLVAVALTALAVWLRWEAPWGSHDLNLRQDHAWRAVDRPSVGYGFGLTGMAVAARTVWPEPWTFRSLTDLNVLLSALHVPLLIRWARQVGTPSPAAVLAGGLVALHPALVRYGHTDVQTNIETLWTLGALCLLGDHLRGGRSVPLVAMGLLLGLAIHARPESMLVPVGVWALGLATDRSWWRTRAAAVSVAVTALVGGPQVIHQVQRLMEATQQQGAVGTPGLDALSQHPVTQHGLNHLLAFDTAYTPALLALGLLAVPWARGPSVGLRALVVVGGLVAALVIGGNLNWTPADGVRIGFVRHQLRAMPFLLLGMAWGWWAVLSRLKVGPWSVGPVMALQTLTLPLAWSPRIGQAELRFVTTWLTSQERGCRIYRPTYPNDAGLWISNGLLSGTDVLFDREPDPPEGDCWLYYRSAECSLDEPDPPLWQVCDRFEATHVLTPIAEAWLAPGPWIYDHHLLDPVRVGLYRVEGPR